MTRLPENSSNRKTVLLRNELVTLSDLERFKTEMLQSIKAMLNEQKSEIAKVWLKSFEVRKLLGISNGTLQTLRNNGTIPFSKVGGIFYYNLSDIEKLLAER